MALWGPALGVLGWLLAGPAAAVEGPLVTAVELRGDAPIERRGELRKLIAVAVGEELDAAAVARSLRNLHAYGSAGEIVAFAEPRPGGVAVVFGLWTRVRVAEVRVVGELGLRRAQLLGALPQRPEQPLSESQVIRGVWALQEMYTSAGYRERQVSVRVDVDPAGKRAVVVYEVAAGTRARVGEVSFAGGLGPFTAAELRAVLRSQTGRHHHEAIAASDVERLEDWLIHRGFRRAAVEPPAVAFDAEDDRVDLEFPIEVGPRFEVEAPGVDLKRLRRKGLLPWLETERFDEALLDQSRELLRRHYQQRGHYDVVIALSQDESAEGVVLRLAIDPGAVFDLTAVRFDGNAAFDQARLAALMETSVARRLGSGGRLVDQIVEDDLDNIRSFYALAGIRRGGGRPGRGGAPGEGSRAGGADRRGAAAAGGQPGSSRESSG